MQTIRMFGNFIMALWLRRHMIIELARRDFKTKYLGSYLGILWAFLHPAIYIVILWFVFQIGFKSRPHAEYPFILWLLCGITPWFFFSESLQRASMSIIESKFLLKQVVFNLSMLPIVRILSALVIHFFFIVAVFVMVFLYQFTITLHSLQVFYYLLATIVLLLGISWLTSSLVVFLRDVNHLVSVVLQFGFWFTPIFWSADILTAKYAKLVKLNPVFYLVEGYRESFLYKTWFWQSHLLLTVYFWAVTGMIFVVGAIVFRRLRPHFADVL